MKEVKTLKGKTINMAAIASKNETTIAVGNMNVNARGDKLGKGGKIVKTFAQIEKERDKKIEVQENVNFSTEEKPQYPYLLKSYKRKGKMIEEWEHEDGSIEEKEVK
jgi:hypothetical protein